MIALPRRRLILPERLRHPGLILDPYLTYGGGGPSGPRLNFSDKHADITLNSTELIAGKSAGGAWRSVRTTNSHTDGFYYFEAKCVVKDGSGGQLMGIMPAADSLAAYVGTGASAVGWYYTQGTRQLQRNATTQTSGGTGATTGEYAGFAVRINGSTGLVKVWVRTSNVAGWLGGGDPSLDYGPTHSFTGTAGTVYFAALSLFGLTDSVEINLGATAFNMTAPRGAAGWDDTALPVPTYADSYWDKVALLVPFEGVDTATTATDATGRHTFTFVGNAQIDTGNAHFPTGGLMLDGVSDGVLANDNVSDFAWAAGQDVTIESWYEVRGFVQQQAIFNNYAGASPAGLLLAIDNSTTLSVRQADSATNTRVLGAALSANTLNHIAFVRNASGAAGNARLFSNGVKVGADITNLTGAIGRAIGSGIGYAGPTFPTAAELDGWIRFTRITFAARYWADFTPPAVPYPMA